MIQPKIIAIAGNRPRSGKDHAAQVIADTLATMLVGHMKQPYRVWTMSTCLQGACREMWDFTRAQMSTDEKDVLDKRWGMTPRRAMQEMGKVMDAKKGLALWPHKVLQEMAKQPLLIMPGIRRANEDVLPIVRGNGILLHVIRPFEDDCPVEWKDAAIEGAVPYGPNDYIITNTGTLEEFKEKVVDFVEFFWAYYLKYDDFWNTPVED